MGVAQGAVVLLHELVRSSSSMRRMQDALETAGFATCNNAELEGLKDVLVVLATRPFIMKRRVEIEHTIHFFESGGCA